MTRQVGLSADRLRLGIRRAAVVADVGNVPVPVANPEAECPLSDRYRGKAEMVQAAHFDRERPLCVPKTLFELMTRWNRLSWRNDRFALFRSGRPGLAIQVEVAA